MSLMRGSEPSFMTAERAATRHGYAARSELALRELLEEFCRARWPDARIVHELVMGAGQVRADVAAIAPAHIAAFEIKGAYDNSVRLLHQVGMFQLCVPEVWICAAENHLEDARLIRHLLPSVGLLVAPGMDRGFGRVDTGRDGAAAIELRVEAEAAPRPPAPRMTLEMLWRDELATCCAARGMPVPARATRGKMIGDLLRGAGPAETVAMACARLRRRDALWRADAPERAAPPAPAPEPAP
jgi:hypothetical protein